MVDDQFIHVPADGCLGASGHDISDDGLGPPGWRPRRYCEPSAFAYGSVAIILRTLEKIFAVVSESPRKYIEKFDLSVTIKWII